MSDSKRKSNPTMNEVAKLAGVSVATVSRVVNGNDGVTKKLEQRVVRAMKALNYHPSSLARSFKQQKTQLIGVMVPLLDHPFYSRLATAIEQRLFQSDYRAIICNSEEKHEREEAYIEMLLRQRVDGVIINTSATDTEYLRDLQEQNIPFVMIDRILEAVQCVKVFSDNSQGGYLGMQHLIELGHRRIGIVAAPMYPELIHRRIQGTRKALEHYDIEPDPELLITSDNQQIEIGYEAALQLMELDSPPTAIFALTDVLAVGVMHAVSSLHMKVPEDISIIGYDDIPFASYMMPPLTTIAQPIVEMGETAVDLLLRQIDNPDLEPDRAVLPTHLVVRESTAPMAKKLSDAVTNKRKSY